MSALSLLSLSFALAASFCRATYECAGRPLLVFVSRNPGWNEMDDWNDFNATSLTFKSPDLPELWYVYYDIDNGTRTMRFYIHSEMRCVISESEAISLDGMEDTCEFLEFAKECLANCARCIIKCYGTDQRNPRYDHYKVVNGIKKYTTGVVKRLLNNVELISWLDGGRTCPQQGNITVRPVESVPEYINTVVGPLCRGCDGIPALSNMNMTDGEGTKKRVVSSNPPVSRYYLGSTVRLSCKFVNRTFYSTCQPNHRWSVILEEANCTGCDPLQDTVLTSARNVSGELSDGTYTHDARATHACREFNVASHAVKCTRNSWLPVNNEVYDCYGCIDPTSLKHYSRVRSNVERSSVTQHSLYPPRAEVVMLYAGSTCELKATCVLGEWISKTKPACEGVLAFVTPAIVVNSLTAACQLGLLVLIIAAYVRRVRERALDAASVKQFRDLLVADSKKTEVGKGVNVGKAKAGDELAKKGERGSKAEQKAGKTVRGSMSLREKQLKEPAKSDESKGTVTSRETEDQHQSGKTVNAEAQEAKDKKLSPKSPVSKLTSKAQPGAGKMLRVKSPTPEVKHPGAKIETGSEHPRKEILSSELPASKPIPKVQPGAEKTRAVKSPTTEIERLSGKAVAQSDELRNKTLSPKLPVSKLTSKAHPGAEKMLPVKPPTPEVEHPGAKIEPESEHMKKEILSTKLPASKLTPKVQPGAEKTLVVKSPTTEAGRLSGKTVTESDELRNKTLSPKLPVSKLSPKDKPKGAVKKLLVKTPTAVHGAKAIKAAAVSKEKGAKSAEVPATSPIAGAKKN